MKGVGDMMKRAQQMRAHVERIQQELASREVEGTAGGGVVRARVTGTMELVSLAIDPAAVDPKDTQMLEDLVRAAVNEALRKSRDLAKEQMASLAGGLSIPGLS